MPPAYDNSLAAYRRVISTYTSGVQIAGIDISSEAIPLAEVFVELQLSRSRRPEGIQHGSPDREREGAARRREHGSETRSALEVLRQSQQLAILGEPGQGKTTVLRRYASLLSREPLSRVPVVVEFKHLREKVVGSTPHLDWLLARLPHPVLEHIRQQGDCRDSLVKTIEEGRGAVLLDGLDELALEAQQQVQELAPGLVHRGNQVVISCRPGAYRFAPLDGFAPYYLQELTIEQIELLATSLCGALALHFGLGDLSPVLQCVMQASQGPAAPLTRSPLLLSFLCFTVIDRQTRNELSDFPHSAAQLMRECLDAVVAWHRRRGHQAWPEDLQAEDVVRILGPLALAAYKNGTRIIKQEYLTPQSPNAPRISPAEKQVFFEHLLPACLVEKRGADFAFPLETFGEYFAARAVAGRDNPYSCVREHLHDPAWERVIVLTVGCLERDRSNMLTRELPTLTWWLRKGFSAVASVVSAFMARGVKEAAEQSGRLLEGPLERWDGRSRRSTEFFITWIFRHGFRLWPLCERPLHYERILMRDLRLATRCLGMCNDPAPKLVRRLVHTCLTRWAEWWGEPFLSSIQEAASAPSVRAFLMEVARHGNDGGLAHGALKGLETSLAQPQVLECVLELVEGREEFMQYDAAQVLARAPFNPSFRDKLLKLSHNSSWTTREAAILALRGGVADARIRERILAMLKDKDRVVRRTAAYALEGAVIEPEIRKVMLRFAHHRDSYFRHVAVLGLSRLSPDSEALKCILRLARDPQDSWVQPEAVCALSRAAESPYIRARLQKVAGGRNSSAREEARRVLGEPPSETAPHEEQRRKLDDILREAENGHAGLPHDSDETIQRALELTEEFPSKYMVRALRPHAGRPNVSRRLIGLTQSADSEVRRAAVHSLELGACQPEVWKHLLTLAQDPRPDLSDVASYALRGAASSVTASMLEQVAPLARTSEPAWETLDILVRAWEERRSGQRGP
jgi:HEAT repeat protein